MTYSKHTVELHDLIHTSISPLVGLLKDEYSNVRSSATTALSYLGEQGESLLAIVMS